MYYVPKTDEQLEAEHPKLVEGEVDWEIISTLLKNGEKINKETGNPEKYQYFEHNVKIYDKNGTQGFIKEFSSNQPKMIWRLKQICDACGLQEQYMNPPLEAFMFNGKSGKGIGHYQKNKDPKYSDQFKLKSFNLPKQEGNEDVKQSSRPQQNSMASDFAPDEDIPF